MTQTQPFRIVERDVPVIPGSDHIRTEIVISPPIASVSTGTLGDIARELWRIGFEYVGTKNWCKSIAYETARGNVLAEILDRDGKS